MREGGLPHLIKRAARPSAVKVAVLGATSATGVAAVQIGHYFGATMTAVARNVTRTSSGEPSEGELVLRKAGAESVGDTTHVSAACGSSVPPQHLYLTQSSPPSELCGQLVVTLRAL